jgi:hypothetical protein
MYKQAATILAILSFVLALVLTGIGGLSDMLHRPLYFSKQHAWNDGIVMMLIAIFFLLLARA